jgi:tetratricopeptide (TPR) repeat protein
LTQQELALLSSARPVDPGAHDDYLHGRYILGMAVAILSKLGDKTQYTDVDTLAAIGRFQHAIERDPAYALAYAGLADAYITLGHPGWGGHSPKETLFDAKEAATKARELDPSLPEAHFLLSNSILTMQTHIWSTDAFCKL